MKITFEVEKSVNIPAVVIPERTIHAATTKKVKSITVNSVTDYPEKKLVEASTTEVGIIQLWKDQEYISIGQWTDSDVIAKINALYV